MVRNGNCVSCEREDDRSSIVTLLPEVVQGLELPPYALASDHHGDELKERDMEIAEELFEQAVSRGEDHLCLVNGKGWDEPDDSPQEEEDSFLQDDDIEEFD